MATLWFLIIARARNRGASLHASL